MRVQILKEIFVWTKSSEAVDPFPPKETELSMLLYHRNLDCRAKRVGSYLQGQGHSVCSVSTKLGAVVHHQEPERILHIVRDITIKLQVKNMFRLRRRPRVKVS